MAVRSADASVMRRVREVVMRPRRTDAIYVPNEKLEQAAIVSLIQQLGGTVYVLGTRRRRGDHQGTMMTPGLPDLFAFLPNPALKVGAPAVGIWIEVKADGGRLSAQQVLFQQRCQWAHVPYLTGGLDAVIGFLHQGGWVKDDQRDGMRV